MITCESTSYHLPARDSLGFCNILLSALGGDGANMAGKLLFKIGCGQFGLDGGYDARYGSEKKGTATDVSVRFCEPGTFVRQSGPTDSPHFLVAFHADLIAPLGLHRGLQPNATCIVNTTRAPEQLRRDFQRPLGRIVCVDATRIAYDAGSRLNMPLLAMLCHELRLPDGQVREVIAQQWPRAAESNAAAYTGALEGAVSATFDDDGAYTWAPPAATARPIGWRNMLNGGAIDALTHSTAGRDNRIASRGRVPAFNEKACNACGLCLTVCSDPGGLLWREGRMVGIDPAFCKGCMRCVEVCPTNKRGHALTMPDGLVTD
jgi:pyruvate ferredoxin oxidoreductase gamma subunit